MNPEYKIEKDSDGDLSVVRTADDKKMADIVHGDHGFDIHPTAPSFHKFKEEFADLLEAYFLAINKAEAEEAGGGEPQPTEAPSSTPEPMPTDLDPLLGDWDPKLIEWRFRTNRVEADKRYAGRNLDAYETLISAEHGR